LDGINDGPALAAASLVVVVLNALRLKRVEA